MRRALNLLQYPSQARKNRLVHRAWTTLAGLLVGALTALWWQQQQALEIGRFQQDRVQLKQSLLTRTQWAKEAALLQKQRQLQSVQLQQLAQMAQQQQAWDLLHVALLQEAQFSGLKLTRLEGNVEKLELHGTAKHVRQMNEARQRLADQWAQPVGLLGLTAGSQEVLDFVWQVAWPDSPSPAAAASPPALRATP